MTPVPYGAVYRKLCQTILFDVPLQCGERDMAIVQRL